MQTFRIEIRQSQFEFKQKSQRCDDLTANSMFCRSRASDNNSSSFVPSFIGKVRLALFLFKIYLIIYCKLLRKSPFGNHAILKFDDTSTPSDFVYILHGVRY